MAILREGRAEIRRASKGEYVSFVRTNWLPLYHLAGG